MKKLIVNISLQKARKSELPTIVSGVLDIVLKHDPALLKIEGFYSKLLEWYQQLYLLKQKYQRQLLSTGIRSQRKRRLKLIGAIVMQINAVIKADVVTLREPLVLILPIVQMHLSNLIRKNLPDIHHEVIHFTTKLKESDELMAAAEATGIKIYVIDLIALEDSLVLDKATLSEANSKLRIPILLQLKLNENTINAYDNLIYSIELARVDNPEIDYIGMIAELNEFLVPYQSIFKSRITRSKTNAEKTMTVAMSTTTSATAV